MAEKKEEIVQFHHRPEEILEFVNYMYASTEANNEVEDRDGLLDMIEDLRTMAKVIISATKEVKQAQPASVVIGFPKGKVTS